MQGQADLDEVDKLFAVYEAQAAADRASTEDKLNKSKSSRQRSMKEIREEGLAAPIATDNKGFQMLAAMGYEHGQGLGKGQSGRSVPLSVEIKGGRHGLGIAENKKRKQQQVEQQQKERDMKRARMQQDMQAEHKVTSAVRAANRRAEAQLLQARQVCETLDQREGIGHSEMWPFPPQLNNDAQADKPVDLGNAGEVEHADAQDTAGVEQASSAWEDWPVHAKLAMVLDHLRQTYHYCFFCACQYMDADDLMTHCPGLQEDDH